MAIERDRYPGCFDSLHLSQYLRLGKGASTAIPVSVKTDVIQAILAVAFLWSGFEGAQQLWIRHIVGDQAGEPFDLLSADVDPVSLLQEQLYQRLKLEPRYELEEDPNRPGHDRLFTARVYIAAEMAGQGTGRSKKEARRVAAKLALESLAKQQG